MSQNITVTLTPDEAIRLGLMRPIAEQDVLKPIGRAFMHYADTQNFGFSSLILTLLQVVYTAGRVEGIRAERNRTRNTNYTIVEEEKMKTGTYISIICPDDTAVSVKNQIAATFNPEEMCIRGNEILIHVPENHGMGFSLNQLRNLVAPCRVSMFNHEPDESGECVRWWY